MEQMKNTAVRISELDEAMAERLKEKKGLRSKSSVLRVALREMYYRNFKRAPRKAKK
jgi:Arc/MetJ-type ribon-helix-helix transcriptional regulator